MTTRERLRRALVGELPDRIPLCETSIWPETLVRWRREGLPDDADPLVWLGMDRIHVLGLDSSLRFPCETVEEDEHTRITRNSDGVVHRQFKQQYSTPQALDFLIKTPDDWLQVRERLEFSPERIPADYTAVVAQSRQDDFWLAIKPREPIWWVLMTMGFEGALAMMMDYPDVVEDMVACQTQLNLAFLDAVVELGKPDAMWHYADLCYKNGMLFSPALFRSLVMPHVKKITSACWERDIIPMYHCDGKVREFIPLLIECGYACVQPLEARAGNDVREFKPKYGDRITLFGNIGVERLSRSIEEAEEEARVKVSAAAPGGRYIFHSDHSVPPTVPFANYRRAVEVARQIGTYA
jgi:uroporphyrinogen decarboxylase